MRREFDYAVVEYANGKPLAEILGASFRGPDGKVVHNLDRPAIENLDALPHVVDVYKRDLDVTRYNVPFLQHPYVALYSTRGCPAQCTFCLWPQTHSGHAWRKRSADDIAAEMVKAKAYWPEVKEFFFDDDTFNIQKARTIELCAKLKPLGLTWSCTSRVTTDFETLKAMKEAGCRLLIVGFESGDAQILKNIKKGATLERARQFVKDCKKLGLAIHGDFILGLPGETRETSGAPSTSPRNSTWRPSRFRWRTPIRARSSTTTCKDNNFIIKQNDMVDIGGHQVAQVQYPGLPADYTMEMVHKFYDEYYFRPKVWVPIVLGSLFKSEDRKRLYKEAKEFLTLRKSRIKAVQEARAKQAAREAETAKV